MKHSIYVRDIYIYMNDNRFWFWGLKAAKQRLNDLTWITGTIWKPK